MATTNKGIVRSGLILSFLSLALGGAWPELQGAEPPPTASITAHMSNTPVRDVACLISVLSHKDVVVPDVAGTPITYSTTKPSTAEEVLHGLGAVLASNDWHLVAIDAKRLKLVQGSQTNGLAEIPRIEIHCEKDSILINQTEVRLEVLAETLKSTVTSETEVWVYDDTTASRRCDYHFRTTDFVPVFQEISGPVRSDRVYIVYQSGERKK